MTSKIAFIGIVAVLAAACGSTMDAAAPVVGATPWPVWTPPHHDPTSTQAVTAVVFNDTGSLAAAANVAITTSSGSYVGTGVTNDQGKIETAVPAMGMLLSAAPADAYGDYQLFGITGLEAGMAVALGGAPAATALAATVNMVFPAPYPGAVFYEANDGCTPHYFVLSGQGQVYQDPLAALCAPDGQFSFMTVAFDGNGNPLAFSFLVDQAVPTDASAQIALPAWTVAAASSAVTMTDIPASTEYLVAEYTLERNGLTFLDFQTEPAISNGTSAVSFPIPAGFADVTSLIFTTYTSSGSSLVDFRQPQAPTELALDVGTSIAAIPTVSLTEGANSTVPMLAWDSVPQGTGAINVSGQWQDPVTGIQWNESILAPASNNPGLTMPVIPATLGTAAQPTASAVRSQLSVNFISLYAGTGFESFAASQGNRPALPSSCTIRQVTALFQSAN